MYQLHVRLASKFARSANTTEKMFFDKKWYKWYADLKSILQKMSKLHQEKVISKTNLTNISKKWEKCTHP